MKSALIVTLSFFIVAHFYAQDSTTITIKKENGEELVTDEIGEQLSLRGNYRWQPWMVWDAPSESFQPDFDLFPSLGFEYDLNEDETAHFYNLGVDVGTDRLMVGTVLRIASHNPRLEENGGLQMAFRAVKRWDFRRIRTTELRIVQKRWAHAQASVEYIFDTKTSKISNESGATEKRQTYVSPSVGVFHPIYERYLIGVKFKRNISLTQENASYNDLSVNFSYFLDL